MDSVFGTQVMSKAEQVKSLLLEGIRSGRYPTGACMPSDNELSVSLGLSRNTVREAMSSLVSGGYLVRIQGKGTFVTKPAAERPASGQRVVAIAGHDVRSLKEGDPFLGEVLKGVHSRLSSLGWGVCLCPFDGKGTFSSHVGRNGLSPSMRQGVIFAGYSVTEEDASLLKREGVPAVSIGRPRRGVDIPYVECDHFLGAATAARHLAGLGHRRIAFFNNRHHEASASERECGWLHALDEAGLAFDPRLLGWTESYGEAELRLELEKFLSPLDFTALLIYGDVATMTALSLLRERGLRVPEDFSVCVYSGGVWLNQAAAVRVTCVSPRVLLTAERAADLLSCVVGGGAPSGMELVKPDFILGGSCAPPPDASKKRRKGI